MSILDVIMRAKNIFYCAISMVNFFFYQCEDYIVLIDIVIVIIISHLSAAVIELEEIIIPSSV